MGGVECVRIDGAGAETSKAHRLSCRYRDEMRDQVGDNGRLGGGNRNNNSFVQRRMR